MRRMTQERGFTIVEMLIAVAILLGGALATLAMLDMANHRVRSAGDRQKATALAREVVEAAKGIPYRDVAPETIVDRLREDASIAGSSASPWRVQRDGTSLTVTTEVCWVDEPADQLGSTAAGGFCEGSGGGTADRTPIDFKRVTVSVTWGSGSGRGTVRQSTLINARSGTAAPAIQSIRLTSPLTPLITSPTTQSASFAVATVANAAAVIWSVDGSQMGTATGSGRNWTFTWQLPKDGAYDVSAQAIEPSGRVGESRSITVVVNRTVPGAPTRFVAGRNGSVVEAEWSASDERDIIGYRVYRQSGATPTVACSFTAVPACVDQSAPSPAGTPLEYWVVALERVGTTNREGAASARVDVNSIANTPPGGPETLTLSKDAQGDTVLNWQPPLTPDPDAGDSIYLYRIYRDGTRIADRVASVGGNEGMWTDARWAGTTHRYWVTAVDRHLAESAPLGPVTG
jgi:prepilin-type N-terminal cleavage/methylation domain-containing protein